MKYFNEIYIGEEEHSDFAEKCYETILYMINRLNEYYKMNPHAFKIIDKLCVELFFSETSENVIDSDIVTVLQDIKIKVKEVIYSQRFYSTFNNTIMKEALSAGLIRYYLHKRGIKLSLKIFSNLFHISQSIVSKATSRIESYIKIPNI